MPLEPPKELIELLWNSLRRGGEHWGEEVILAPRETGFEVVFPLVDRLPPGTARPLLSYIKGFMREGGWKALVKVFPHEVRIALSKA